MGKLQEPIRKSFRKSLWGKLQEHFRKRLWGIGTIGFYFYLYYEVIVLAFF
jgi:hypothetical protein